MYKITQSQFVVDIHELRTKLNIPDHIEDVEFHKGGYSEADKIIITCIQHRTKIEEE